MIAWPVASQSGLCLVALALLALPSGAEVIVPPGFEVHAYVSGDGFEAGMGSGMRGIPSTSTLAFDEAGTLYLGRTGRRYTGGEVEDLWPLYRIPLGGARLTPGMEAQYFYGPPLLNAQVAAMRAGRELFITTFDRDRKVGAVYRMLGGRAELFAGGTPPAGGPPLLVQPEGAAVDAAGNLYVADRAQDVIVRLDPAGRVLDPRYVSVARPRLMAAGESGHLWIGSDGTAEAPWQRGTGEIVKVVAGRAPTVVLRGPLIAAMAVSPTGRLFVADRQGTRIFFLDSEGKPVEFASFTDGDAPRSLAFAPITPQTRAARIAGDLFVVTVNRGAWRVNEVLRISGPLDAPLRGR